MLRFHLPIPLFEEAPGDPSGSGAPAFDPAAFQASLLGEVGKLLDQRFKAFKPAAPPPPAPNPEPPADPKPGDKSPQVAALERQNKDLADRFKALEDQAKQTAARAEEKERHAAIRSSLGDFQFASDDARDDAFRAFREEVKRGEDGELYGGDMVPLKDFIKTRMGSKTHLLAPKPVDSAGARPNAGIVGGKRVQLEDIRAGMDPRAREAAWASVRALMGH